MMPAYEGWNGQEWLPVATISYGYSRHYIEDSDKTEVVYVPTTVYVQLINGEPVLFQPELGFYPVRERKHASL